MNQNKHSHTLCFINYLTLALFGTLFFVIILLGYFNIIPLKVNIHSIFIIGGIYFIYLFFIRHNANYVVCKMRSQYVDLQKELQKSIKNNSLTILNETKSTINIENFITNYYKTFRNDNYASIASSVFPMLGILGTFSAIALSMPDFSSANTDALDHEISILLSGIGTAFYASIYGIYLSIVWSFFEKRGLSKVDFDSHQLDEVYASYIWSDSELKRHEHMQHEMRDQKMVEALKETFNLEFIQTLNEKHLENFQTIINETNKNFTSITNHMQMVSTDLKDTIAKIEASKSAITAQEKIEQSIKDFTEKTATFNNTLTNFDTTLEKSLNLTFTKIDNEVGEIVIKLANFAHSTAEQNKILQHTITEYHKSITKHIEK